jgi:hypothetical protein
MDPGIDFLRPRTTGLAGPGSFDFVEQRMTIADVLFQDCAHFLFH